MGNYISVLHQARNLILFLITKKTLQDVSNEVHGNLKPLPNRLDIEVVNIEEVDVIRVMVEGDDTPYSAYGRYYIRIDDGDIPMSNYQLQKFFEDKEDNYSSWEEKPTNFSFDDIDEELLIKVIRSSNEKGRLNYVYDDVEKALRKLDLLTADGKLKQRVTICLEKENPSSIKRRFTRRTGEPSLGRLKSFEGTFLNALKKQPLIFKAILPLKPISLGY